MQQTVITEREILVIPGSVDLSPSYVPNFRQDDAYSVNFEVDSKINTSQNQTLDNIEPPALRDPQSSLSEKKLSERFLNIFSRRSIDDPTKQPDIQINTKSVIIWCLVYMAMEYALYFGFALISLLVLQEFWEDSTFVVGAVAAFIYLLIGGILMSRLLDDRLGIQLMLKFLAFCMYAVLIGWGVAFLEFSMIALSYIILFDIFMLMFIVRLLGFLLEIAKHPFGHADSLRDCD